MSEKRRDNRNRILHEGEYQRADGRYRFRYVDIHGNEGNLYSWRLDHNDPIPKGKKMELSLREKEKQLEQDRQLLCRAAPVQSADAGQRRQFRPVLKGAGPDRGRIPSLAPRRGRAQTAQPDGSAAGGAERRTLADGSRGG